MSDVVNIDIAAAIVIIVACAQIAYGFMVLWHIRLARRSLMELQKMFLQHGEEVVELERRVAELEDAR